MTPQDAATLLELPTDASAEQLEARFLEMRTKLEDKISRAPTPGLKEKYRALLAQLTVAFETLTLAADASMLPVLQQAATASPAAPASVLPTAEAAPGQRPTASRKSSQREFLVVAALAICMLAGGVWWVIKTRAEKAERARIEAEAAAQEQLRQQEAAAEAERLAKLSTQLRTQLAEAAVSWEAYDNEIRDAERRASDARSEFRSFRDGPETRQAELSAIAAGEEMFSGWLKSYLIRHPAKIARAKAEQLLADKAVTEAAAAVQELSSSLASIDQDIRHQRDYLLTNTATVSLETTPEGVSYVLTDTFGRVLEGVTPARHELPLTHVHLTGPDGQTTYVKRGELTTGVATVEFVRPGWQRVVEQTELSNSDVHTLSAEFPEGALKVDAQPAGVPFRVENDLGLSFEGKAPAELSAIPPGPVRVIASRPGFRDVVAKPTVTVGETAVVTLDQRAQVVRITVAESGSRIFVDGKRVGAQAVTLDQLPPGEHQLQLELQGYPAYRTRFRTAQQATQLVLEYSFHSLAQRRHSCTTCGGFGQTYHERRCTGCSGRKRITCTSCKGRGYHTWDMLGNQPCPYCDGTGREQCLDCSGTGKETVSNTCGTCDGHGMRSDLDLAQ